MPKTFRKYAKKNAKNAKKHCLIFPDVQFTIFYIFSHIHFEFFAFLHYKYNVFFAFFDFFAYFLKVFGQDFSWSVHRTQYTALRVTVFCSVHTSGTKSWPETCRKYAKKAKHAKKYWFLM